MGDRAEVSAQIIGHMVRFMPKEEKKIRGTKDTRIMAPKVGAFVIVVVDDPAHY